MSDYGHTDHEMPLFDAVKRAPAADQKRLNGQCLIILDRLRQGPATNEKLWELSKARNLSGRISDLRAAGYSITCERLAGGVTRYTLKET